MSRTAKYRAEAKAAAETAAAENVPPPPPSRLHYKRPKNPKGWLPKTACLIIAFLWLPRTICISGICFIIAGIILTICGYSDGVRYDDKVAGPVLLALGPLMVGFYVWWKNFRRGGGERDTEGEDGVDNPGFTQRHVPGRSARHNDIIINIPKTPKHINGDINANGGGARPKTNLNGTSRPKSAASTSTSSSASFGGARPKSAASSSSSSYGGARPKTPAASVPAITLSKPSTSVSKQHSFSKNIASTSSVNNSRSMTDLNMFAASSSAMRRNSVSMTDLQQIGASGSGMDQHLAVAEVHHAVTASPVISLRAERKRRNLSGSGDGGSGTKQTVKVDLHNAPPPKDGIYVIQTGDDEDSDDANDF